MDFSFIERFCLISRYPTRTEKTSKLNGLDLGVKIPNTLEHTITLYKEYKAHAQIQPLFGS